MSPNEVMRPPDLPEFMHRPAGHPMPREARSQKAQLESAHQHSTSKDRKIPFVKKIGHEK